jgi:hypothetical protein
MKIFETFTEVYEKAPVEIISHVKALIDIPDSFLSVPESNHPKANPNMRIEDWWGGSLCLIESVEDLKYIETTTEDPHDENRWLSLGEAPGYFDSIVWLHDRSYLVIWYACNNSGGPSFYIPRHIAVVHPHILKSMEINNAQDADN